ncbi:MAG: AraC family transcriptional regulator ligand-binding domain-containing protein, partial [Proteobacteria bacterium]|nr:AraC family transcriptional regulator ligand-binding domain-containing protein [Pseudomonadota bacterium]
LAANLPALFEEVLHRPERVPNADLRVFLTECEAISGDRHIGLHLVDLIDIHSYGIFGYLLANSPTPRLLLETAARYYPIFHRYSELELSVADGVAHVEYRVTRPGRDDRRHDNEWSLGAFVTLTRAQIDPSWMPARVTFTNESPGELNELHRVFGTALEFRQPVNCFEFDAALLDQEGLDGDPDLFAILVEHADGLLAQLDGPRSFESQVSLTIMQHLGRSPGNEGAVADELMLSLSTFKRRLKENGLTYRQLRAKVIVDLARSALATSDASVAEIAQKLGYAESSAFVRAFKNLVGVTPFRYRRAQLHRVSRRAR